MNTLNKRILFVGLFLTNCLVLVTSKASKNDDEDSISTGGKVLIGVGVGASAVLAAPMVLGAAGFTAAGVAAGSLAAGVQSVVYAGATTGVFSVLQSVGAAGVGLAGTAVGVVGGIVGYFL